MECLPFDLLALDRWAVPYGLRNTTTIKTQAPAPTFYCRQQSINASTRESKSVDNFFRLLLIFPESMECNVIHEASTHVALCRQKGGRRLFRVFVQLFRRPLCIVRQWTRQVDIEMPDDAEPPLDEDDLYPAAALAALPAPIDEQDGAKKRGAGDEQEEDDGQAVWNRTVQDADYEDQFDP